MSYYLIPLALKARCKLLHFMWYTRLGGSKGITFIDQVIVFLDKLEFVYFAYEINELYGVSNADDMFSLNYFECIIFDGIGDVL